MTAAERQVRTDAADAQCAEAYRVAGGPEAGVALIAVGGYGRGELAPFSDWDLVLVHEDDVDPGPLASELWYPLWDRAPRLDHAVRSVSAMRSAAEADLKVALGLLDVRHLAGDPGLTLRLRTTLLAQWRRSARRRLPELRDLNARRHELVGEVAHASVPDLKEGAGGLRDATVLTALSSSWLVDVPQVDLERWRRELLDVRDLVHDAAGRASDRIGPEGWSAVADGLGLPDERGAQAHVRQLGRRLSHLSGLVWRRVDAYLSRPARRPTRPQVASLGGGVGLLSGEIVLDVRADPAGDPLLVLRAATEAAERDLVLAPTTAARLAREGAALPEPWPPEARRLLVRLLAAGHGLTAVWETLDQTGALQLILPEWERIRLLPHASSVHRFTVDRHVVETCVESAALIRQVDRPDVLLVAALLHDIGKGQTQEHSIAGEPIARRIATRMGFDEPSVELIALLVRHHLLLATTATTRDPDDPATVAHLAATVGSAEALGLLTALTEADARATSAKAWSSWRAGLVRDLAGRAMRALDHDSAAAIASHPAETAVEVPPAVRAGGVQLSAERVLDGTRVTVVAPDRVGVMAETSAAIALGRIPVRACRAWVQHTDGKEYAVSVWDLAADSVDVAVLRTRLLAIREGRIDTTGRLHPGPDPLPPSVAVRPEASTRATVLEVRAADRPGTVHLVCAALARLQIAVRSAHVDTLGPQAVDVFYLQEAYAGALSDQRAAEAAHGVRAALVGTTS